MTTVQHFTADVVEYSFLPEKYATAQTLVEAEINVIIRKDWQQIVELWFKSGIGAQYKDLLLDAQNTELRFEGTARVDTAENPYSWKTNEVANYGMTEETKDVAKANAIDKALAKTLLYAIGGASGFYKGDGVISPTIGAKDKVYEGMTNILQALLTAQTSDAQNELIIDDAAVTKDLSAGSGGEVGYLIPSDGFEGKMATGVENKSVASKEEAFNVGTAANSAIIAKINNTWPDLTNQTLTDGAQHVSDSMSSVSGEDVKGRTAVLSQVLNAEAFRPVINRLIAGGNFFVNLADGVKTYSSDTLNADGQANERKFSINRKFGITDGGEPAVLTDAKRDDTPVGADKNTQIAYDSELVFPVQINVADVNSYNTTGDSVVDQIDYSRLLSGDGSVAAGAGNTTVLNGDPVLNADGSSNAATNVVNSVRFNLNIRFKPFDLAAMP